MKARLPQGYGGGPGNIQQMLKQAQQAQEKMEQNHAEKMCIRDRYIHQAQRRRGVPAFFILQTRGKKACTRLCTAPGARACLKT